MLKELKGTRLVKFEPALHTGQVYSWYYDNAYTHFFRNYPNCPSIDEVVSSMSGKTFMVLHEEKIVGMVMYFNQNEFSRKVEVGVIIDKTCERKKIGTTAFKVMIYYLLNTLNLYKVSVTVVADNARLNTLLERMGFSKEGHFKNSVYYDAEFHDENFWSIFKGEFNKKYKQEFMTAKE